MLHTVEDLIRRIEVMKDKAILVHRLRNEFAEISNKDYDHETCKRLIDDIQTLALSNSKLFTVVPRFWLTRPKGGHNLELVTLDTVIDYDPMQPTQLIDKLLLSHKASIR